MHRTILFSLVVFILFSSFSCEDECEFAFNDFQNDSELPAEIQNARLVYAIGDTILLGASFSAVRPTEGGGSFTVGPNGGLVASLLYRVERDTNVTLSLAESFTTLALDGPFVTPLTGATPGVVRQRYGCPQGVCSFLQGFVATEPGEYIVQLLRGTVEEVSAPFNYCFEPRLGFVTLEGGSNLPEGLDYPLETVAGNDTGQFFGGSFIVDPSQADVFYFTVQ